MLVSEVKPIGKIGKNMLKENNPDELIKKIIEKPLQSSCIKCKEKNIETVMSSANRNNIIKNGKEIMSKKNLIKMLKSNKFLSYDYIGKGYAWLMINYNNLSDENRNILFSLEKDLGEDTILFIKENFTDVMNYLRKKFKIKEKSQFFNDTYANDFKNRQLKLVYKNNYPTRNVVIRMPISESTNSEDVELYFDNIIDNLVEQ